MRIRELPGVASGPLPAKPFLVAFNGTSTPGSNYSIGIGASGDHAHWQTQGIAKLFVGAGWESSLVKDASIIWDGTQFVMYYSGYDGTRFQIGRATASIFNGDWTKYASNPIVAHGASGDPDEIGGEFPVVHFDGTTYRMWYTGQPSGWSSSTNPISTVCFADSTDGITWTKHGTVIARGAVGAFNEKASLSGAVFKSGSTWYVYMAGYNSSFIGRSAYCTTTNPASAAAYSGLTQLSNYTGNVTVGGKTWQSNLPRGIIANPDGTYTAFMDVWNPTDTSSIRESCVQVASADLTSWAAPSALMLPFDSWSTVSAENPSVIVAP